MHGEVTDPEIDIFDREAVFIDKILDPIRRKIPKLKVVMEHVTTKDGINYVKSGNADMLAASLTVHHLVINRNAIFKGGIRPHYYCLPIAKRELHRLALLEAAVSGDPCFFLGTDSAPHADDAKESPCGCAGLFTATNAMGVLAQVFENEKKLARLENFVSRFGAEFYGEPLNTDTLTLVRQDEPVEFPKKIETGDGPVTVFDPEIDVFWKVEQ